MTLQGSRGARGGAGSALQPLSFSPAPPPCPPPAAVEQSGTLLSACPSFTGCLHPSLLFHQEEFSFLIPKSHAAQGRAPQPLIRNTQPLTRRESRAAETQRSRKGELAKRATSCPPLMRHKQSSCQNAQDWLQGEQCQPNWTACPQEESQSQPAPQAVGCTEMCLTKGTTWK